MKRVRKAMATKSKSENGTLIHFIPGGHYWLKDGNLYTGVHKRLASATIQEKLIELAIKANKNRKLWVAK